MDEQALDAIFGPSGRGGTAEERARASTRVWVRSQDHLALQNEGSTGMPLASDEALELFGIDVLAEAIDKGSAIIAANENEPAASIRRLREARGWSCAELAQAAQVTADEVADAEDPRTRTPMAILEKVTCALDADPRSIGFTPL